jgi:rhodanese-related sulfurtransferase
MTRRHRALAILAVSLAASALLLDLRPSAEAWSPPASTDAGDFISAPDLAARIIGQDRALRVVDLRAHQDFELLHVAGAIHMTLDDLRHEETPSDMQIVLYADEDDRALKGLRLLHARGHVKAAILREGIAEWIGRVIEPRLATDATAAERAEFDRAAQLSRFFGGMPRSYVPRSELPRGYWTGAPRALTRGSSREFTRLAIAGIRRRGC